nr:hypothetical protein [Tanacetum cinerariifolium]
SDGTLNDDTPRVIAKEVVSPSVVDEIKWHTDVNLLKDDVDIVSVWVKLHGVPVTAFSEDGLSSITTKLGTPLMLNSYTDDMYMQSWGRSSYCRAMIELRANVELKDDIVVDMPKITGRATYMFYPC